MMFDIHHKRKKARNVIPFDREKKIPAIRCSICTGEQVAGFKNKVTGRFEESVLIRSDADLQEFLERYGLQASEVKREW